MTPYSTVGSRGESLAVEFLQEKGVVILERNWRHGRGEVDIIGYREDMLLIIEVKTRSSCLGGFPEQKVGLVKFRMMQQTAEAYMALHQQWKKVRFDVLSILLPRDGQPASFFLLEDVFFWSG